MDLTTDIGMERIQRAVTVLMVDHINEKLTSQQNVWSARDAAFFAATGRSDPGFTLEAIPAANIYSGTIPSLITAPASGYPNICVIAYQGQPIGVDDDWNERYAITLSVEIMVKSLILEEEVNSRIQRTLEAAHNVLLSENARRIPDLDGEPLCLQISQKPVVTISDVFVRHTNADPNARSFYQHGSLTYRVEKFSAYE